MTFRFWISVITFILLSIVVILGWGEIVRAWNLLGSVNIWIWLLLIPVQLLSYYATGEMIFTYLRSKGDLKTVSSWSMTRTALELNFVNHIFPSGGAAGFSYLGWVLHRSGVSAGRATMAQIIRFVLTFVSFVMIVIISVITLTFDHKIDRTILMVSSLLIVLAVGGVTAIIYAVGNHKRLVRFSSWLTRVVNNIVSKLTRGKKEKTLVLVSVEKFFTDLHQDYLEIMNDKKILAKPFIWAVVANILDVVFILGQLLCQQYYIMNW
jgi:hypothetical protein